MVLGEVEGGGNDVTKVLVAADEGADEGLAGRVERRRWRKVVNGAIGDVVVK